MNPLDPFFKNNSCNIKALVKHLNGLDSKNRVDQLQYFTKKYQHSLWDAVDEAEKLTLDYFVPKDTSDLTPVVHHGYNVIPFLKKFQKIMFRSTPNSAIYGLNAYAGSPLVGNGYFGVRETNSMDLDHGGIVVDYGQYPNNIEICKGWPKAKPAGKDRLGGFFYSNNLDFMRKVSDHISIGRMAPKGLDRFSKYTFVLCRED